MRDSGPEDAELTEIHAIASELVDLHEHCRNWIGPVSPRLEACNRLEALAARVRALDKRPRVDPTTIKNRSQS